jgi:NAD-dependent dihydropyrimidine dehydrogenase PreA subunit
VTPVQGVENRRKGIPIHGLSREYSDYFPGQKGGMMPVVLDQDKCDGCGFCVKGCTMMILRLESGRLEVVDAESCAECGYCITSENFKLYCLVYE